MMRYVATRNVQMVYRNEDGKQTLGTVLAGHLAPVEVTPDDARAFVVGGFLREVDDNEAARILRGPQAPDLAGQVQRAFLAGF